MSGKFWWYTHAIKSFPSPAQPPPKKERCVMLSMRFPEKTVLVQKKKKAKAFYPCFRQTFAEKSVSCCRMFFVIFLPLLIFI